MATMLHKTSCFKGRTSAAMITVTAFAGLLLVSCSSDVSPPSTSTFNTTYYDSLKTNSSIDDPQAQPPAHELFSENTKHFDLVQVTAKQMSMVTAAQNLPEKIALYAPRSAKVSSLAKKSVASAVPGSGIPGFKPADVIPAVCAGVSTDSLRQCLDDNNVSMAPAPIHISYHDTQTLTVLLGNEISDMLLSNLLSSFSTHIDTSTRNAIEAQLNNYIAANPAHIGLNLARHDIFNPSGYYINTMVITDGSQGDSNGDGLLEPHSTLIVELKKPLDYIRTPSSALNAAIAKYSARDAIPEERYEITLKAYIHLDQLSSYRQPLPEPPAEIATKEQQLAYYAKTLQVQAINHAFDTNVIKKVLASGQTLPWNSTEYTLSFQLATDTISGQYAPMLEKATANADTAAIDTIEGHIDAQSALITGSSLTANGDQNGSGGVSVMYQVNMPQTALNSGTDGGYDYAMVDSLGRRIAIYDPSTGSVILAGSQRGVSIGLDKQVGLTAAGACRDDKSNWAYIASRIRTPRFGRGIQWILTEWLIHNQVGDYKNIHWYQSTWKAGTQVAIKAGTFIFTTYLKIQAGSVGIPPYKGGKAAVYLVEGVLPYFANTVSNMGHGNKFKIAGYELQGLSLEYQFLVQMGVVAESNPTFLEKVGDGIKNAVIGFAIDRLGQGLAQTLDVTAVGWQDFSDGSHHGCFKFD